MWFTKVTAQPVWEKPEALSHYSNTKCRKLELWLSQERDRIKENKNRKFYWRGEWNKMCKKSEAERDNLG